MKLKNLLVILLVLGLTVFSVASFAAKRLKGTINVVGSTSVQPLAEELAKKFTSKRKNKKVKIFVQGGGSGAGIKAAFTKTADIGMSSRSLKPSEKGLIKTVIARDGIAIIVNKKNSIGELTSAQLKKIYKGEYTNWKEVGGKNMQIIVVNREAGSGTRGAFEGIVLKKEKPTNTCLIQASTGAVQQTVSVTKEAIGYVSLGSLDTKVVNSLKIDGAECTAKNIKAEKYPIQRPFLMVTKSAPKGIVKAFLNWILSKEGQKIVAEDFISVK